MFRRDATTIAALALLVLGAAAPLRARGAPSASRLAGPEALDVPVERFQLPNGLVVLLSPDPSVSTALVWSTFRAGTLYEPPGKSGLAHLVEHLMATGPTPETDYVGLLERRRARDFNAVTGFDAMTFRAEVPAEEVAAAIWVAADRLGSLAGTLDEATVARSRRIVAQERASELVDQPYGLVEELLVRRLYPAPNPLRGGVLGDPAELAACSLADVRAFVAERLVPANGLLTIVGRFDPIVVRALVTERFGALPAGRPAAAPAFPAPTTTFIDRGEESRAREPKVWMAWRIPDLAHDHAQALALGAQLLTFLTDGAWGMRIAADLHEYAGEAVFTMALTLPHDEPMQVIHGDADAFLRLLTHREMPADFVQAANLALDRVAMLELDGLAGRAQALTRLELAGESRRGVGAWLGAHWELDRQGIQATARSYLQEARVVVHARPTRPRPAKAERP
jgi:predicted Zn-dependent peptidase